MAQGRAEGLYDQIKLDLLSRLKDEHLMQLTTLASSQCGFDANNYIEKLEQEPSVNSVIELAFLLQIHSCELTLFYLGENEVIQSAKIKACEVPLNSIAMFKMSKSSYVAVQTTSEYSPGMEQNMEHKADPLDVASMDKDVIDVQEVKDDHFDSRAAHKQEDSKDLNELFSSSDLSDIPSQGHIAYAMETIEKPENEWKSEGLMTRSEPF